MKEFDPYLYDDLHTLIESLAQQCFNDYNILQRRDNRITSLISKLSDIGAARVRQNNTPSRSTIIRHRKKTQQYLKYQCDSLNNVFDVGLNIFMSNLEKNDEYKIPAMQLLHKDFIIQHQNLCRDFDKDPTLGIARALQFMINDITHRQLKTMRYQVSCLFLYYIQCV